MRILIAEDDPVLADGLSRSLRATGYAVDVVGDGEAADAALVARIGNIAVMFKPRAEKPLIALPR